MPAKVTTICFRDIDQYEMAKRKANERKKSLSAMIQDYFEELSDKKE